MSETTPRTSLTSEAVDLPGVDPADPPTELVPGKLWQGGVPVDFDWVRRQGLDAVVDVSDADSHPPAGAVSDLVYLKCPLVDGDDLPDPAITLPLAEMIAGLIKDGRRVFVHCTFGRNRSGLLVTLIVRQVLGVSGAEALDYVRERRDRAVNNEDFAAWLRSLPVPS
jgi:hypothetical protein